MMITDRPINNCNIPNETLNSDFCCPVVLIIVCESAVGVTEGDRVGDTVGLGEGRAVVGWTEGEMGRNVADHSKVVGFKEGGEVGDTVGGLIDGDGVGGLTDGDDVGTGSVGSITNSFSSQGK